MRGIVSPLNIRRLVLLISKTKENNKKIIAILKYLFFTETSIHVRTQHPFVARNHKEIRLDSRDVKLKGSNRLCRVNHECRTVLPGKEGGN